MMKNILVVGLYSQEACPVFSLKFAKALQHLENQVYAILPFDIENKSEWIQCLSAEHIVFLKLSKKRKFQKYTNLINFIANQHSILKPLRNIKFDLVFYTFFHRWNGIIRHSIKSEKQILFVHDPIPHSDEKSNRLKLQSAQIVKMDGIIVLSKKFISDCKVIYNLSDNNIFFMPHCLMGYSNGNAHTRYTTNQCLNFLFFGRITKYKGLNILIEAFKNLEKEFPWAHLSIVGGGDMTDYIDQFKQLTNATLINKYLYDDEIGEWFLKENTVCVLPYLDATQSGVITIAYEYGTVIIATDTGGLKEQLGEGAVGLFCKSGSVNELYKAMKKVCENFNVIYEQSIKMREFAKTLSWDVATDRLLKDINNVQNN